MALSYIDDIIIFEEEYILDNNSSYDEDHKRRYMEVAWWLWTVTIAGMATEVFMLLIRAQYLGQTCKDNFIIFAAIVSFYNIMWLVLLAI